MKLRVIFVLVAAVVAAPQTDLNINATPGKADTFLTRQQGTPVCKYGFSSSVSAYEISQRINDLKARTDDCVLHPHQCQMLECAYNAGIQWCNNNDHYASWKCADFAAHAQGIINQCSFGNIFTQSEEVWAREPDDQGFEVQVGYSAYQARRWSASGMATYLMRYSSCELTGKAK